MLSISHLFVAFFLIGTVLSSPAIRYITDDGDSAVKAFSIPKKITKFKMFKLDDKMKQKFVDAHNLARAAVDPAASNMQAVSWDDKIAKISKKFVKKCQFMHSQGDERTIKQYDYPLGENLFVGMSRAPQHTDPSYITGRWDGEKVDYNINDLSCTPGKMCGHYTQVVWADTTKIGCAIGLCPSVAGTYSNAFDTLVACHYGPTGNWRGEKPYDIGKPCSSCPADANVCRNDLCYAE